MHGETQWQQDHWKAMNARRGAWTRSKDTVEIRWQEDEKVQTFSASPRMHRIILPILGLIHDDRHLLHRTLASKAPVREHHHVGLQR